MQRGFVLRHFALACGRVLRHNLVAARGWPSRIEGFTQMTKSEATATAHSLGLAVYRGDTVAKIEARIASHRAALVELCSATRRAAAKMRSLHARATYRPAGPRQLFLPMAMPHNLIVACGVAL